MKKRIFSIVMVFILLFTGTGFIVPASCEVHFIDAGQSDCILIKGEKHNFMIDTGAAYYTDSILSYLYKNNVKCLKTVILTHYHDDHYGGLLKICQKIKVQEVCMPSYKSDMGEALSRGLKDMGIKVKHIGYGYTLEDEKINLQDIGPIRYDKKVENNNSLVLQGEIDGISYLLPGDCEKNEESDMMNLNLVKKCEVLKVPHHTLNTSGSDDFLNTVKPQVMIATCNGVDTPDLKNLQRYARFAPVLRSDINGNIVIRNSSIGESKGEIIIRLNKNS